MAQSDARPTGAQEVAGSIPAGSGIILSWRSFSPFRWSKKGMQFQLLAKECAQVLVNRLTLTKPAQEKYG